jgi:hypothetical protein
LTTRSDPDPCHPSPTSPPVCPISPPYAALSYRHELINQPTSPFPCPTLFPLPPLFRYALLVVASWGDTAVSTAFTNTTQKISSGLTRSGSSGDVGPARGPHWKNVSGGIGNLQGNAGAVRIAVHSVCLGSVWSVRGEEEERVEGTRERKRRKRRKRVDRLLSPVLSLQDDELTRPLSAYSLSSPCETSSSIPQSYAPYLPLHLPYSSQTDASRPSLSFLPSKPFDRCSSASSACAASPTQLPFKLPTASVLVRMASASSFSR